MEIPDRKGNKYPEKIINKKTIKIKGSDGS